MNLLQIPFFFGNFKNKKNSPNVTTTTYNIHEKGAYDFSAFIFLIAPKNISG